MTARFQSSHKLYTDSNVPSQDLQSQQRSCRTVVVKLPSDNFSHFHFNVFVHYLLFLQTSVMNKVHTITDIGLSAINKQMGCCIKLSGKMVHLNTITCLKMK